MAFDFSTLITDRSPEDLQALRDLLATPMADWTAEQLAQFNQAASKGAYNYTDLNRVIAAMDDINVRLTAAGYETGYQRIRVPHQGGEDIELPEGYTRLAWIESTGSQYIDTGITPTQDTQIVLDYMPTAVATVAVFGSRVGVGNAAFALWIVDATSIEDDYASDRDTITVSNLLERTCVVKDGNILDYGDIGHEHTETVFSNQYPIALFGINSAGTVDSRRVSARLYSCSIRTGTDKRDYIPCRAPDGSVGLYDLVNGQFYGNAGTGEFIAGTEVPNLPQKDPYTWYESDTPTQAQMTQYLANVEALKGALTLADNAPELPLDMDGLTTQEANHIEEILVMINLYLLALQRVFIRSGMAWAISGGPNYYFKN